MNGLERRDKFSPSQTPYAFQRNLYEIHKPHERTAWAYAIWAGRKNGLTTVSIGWLHGRAAPTVDEFIDTVDMRYGGSYEGKWDGASLITERAIPENRRQALVRVLTPILDGFPALPDRFDGWYYRR